METHSIIRPPESRAMKSGRVVLMPGEEMPEHVTENREEIIVVLKGNAALVIEGNLVQIREGETHYIKEGTLHAVKNISTNPVEYVYIVSLFANI